MTKQLFVQRQQETAALKGGQTGRWGWPHPGQWWSIVLRGMDMVGGAWWVHQHSQTRQQLNQIQSSHQDYHQEEIDPGPEPELDIRLQHGAKSIQEKKTKTGLETSNRVALCLYKSIICTCFFSIQDVFWSFQGTSESHFVSRMFWTPCDRKAMWTEEKSTVSSLTFIYCKKIHYFQWNICWLVFFLNGIS